MKSIKKTFKDFLKSFKLKFDFLQIILFDLLFYAVVIPSYKISSSTLKNRITQLKPSEMASAAQLQAQSLQLKETLALTIIITLSIILVTFLMWVLSRGLIYTKLLKKKFTKKYFIKFMGLNVFLSIVLLPILFLSSIFLRPVSIITAISVLVISALIYFTALTYIKFTQSLKVFESIGDALSFGTKKFPKLLIPIILILAVGYIFTIIWYLIPQYSYINLILFVVYAAWARIYFVSEIKKHET